MSKLWHVITGAPSSGKSTIINQLAELKYNTQKEFGRFLIDKDMENGKTLEVINVDSAEFEIAWVGLQERAEKKLDPDQTTFIDRGIIDTLAYFRYYNWKVPNFIQAMCNKAVYSDTVFLLEMLKYEQDGKRVESESTARHMQELFADVYTDFGYHVVRVPVDTVENRLNFILSHIN